MPLEKQKTDAKKQNFEAPLISIVDDDASVRVSTEAASRSGFRAEAFSSAEEFLRSEFLAQTACLLLDVCIQEQPGLLCSSRDFVRVSLSEAEALENPGSEMASNNE